MSSKATVSQVPPADELWEVRAAIKELTSRERELRATVLADPEARMGNAYCVEIKSLTTTRTDIKEMRKLYPEIVEQFTFPLSEQRVELLRITEDGEMVSTRRKTAA